MRNLLEVREDGNGMRRGGVGVKKVTFNMGPSSVAHFCMAQFGAGGEAPGMTGGGEHCCFLQPHDAACRAARDPVHAAHAAAIKAAEQYVQQVWTVGTEWLRQWNL